ncbi:ABC transporter, ATP-binding protein [Pediococcus damnosus]|uniref:ATP-binding cassette domain-containing protein n=1 Tax=Pediococcus damnosus TaxID=51663 RepID=UPI00078CE670|nr:ATP-binding cassette domain-containing protein [Pediococcus damnosus]AMV60590.1 ABC transporter, ATP-binding protein [Pediococcus damnosus]AMV64903.1 ABC transporter, ATP-binding protein [Pediococcus damnosus]
MDLIIARQLSRKLRNGTMLLQDINMSVEKGEILAVEGENGAGKTVLLKALLGLTPSSGDLIVDDRRFKLGDAYPIKAGILIENPSLINEFTAIRNLRLLATLLPQVTDDEVHTVLRSLNLDPTSRTLVKNFSLGMKEKLGIAQALLGHNPLIVLDEPTNALDDKSKMNLVLLARNYRDLGSTFLIASHDQDFIKQVATRRIRMTEGHLNEKSQLV